MEVRRPNLCSSSLGQVGLANEQILQSLLRILAPVMRVGVQVSWPLAWHLSATDPLLGIWDDVSQLSLESFICRLRVLAATSLITCSTAVRDRPCPGQATCGHCAGPWDLPGSVADEMAKAGRDLFVQVAYDCDSCLPGPATTGKRVQKARPHLRGRTCVYHCATLICVWSLKTHSDPIGLLPFAS